MEALIATSTLPVTDASREECRVLSGRYHGLPDEYYMMPLKLDIGHVLPLAWEWKNGAVSWAKAQRFRFENDPIKLRPVEASLNSRKCAKGPEKWMPPGEQCQQIIRFIRVMKTDNLNPPRYSKSALRLVAQLLARGRTTISR